MTDKAMMQRIKQNVLEVDPQAEVWLYGSRARGTANEESDWDVLVLTPQETVTTAEESRFIDHMCDLIVETGEVIQLRGHTAFRLRKRRLAPPPLLHPLL